MNARLEEIERLVALATDADDVLRAVVSELVREPSIEWAGIQFLDEGAPVGGPETGTPEPARRLTVPVIYQGTPVGELAADGEADRSLLEATAELIATHVLLGWDTGGQVWEP